MKILNHKLIKQWPGIDQSHPAIQSLDNIVSWRVPPPFDRVGRSAWLPLETPITVATPHGEVVVEALKIKGVGLYDFEGNLHQPSASSFKMASPHLGITKEGKFAMIPPASKPLGAIALEKANMEYKIADTLIESGIPSAVPIRVYQYEDTDLIFHTQDGTNVRLGVVVMGQLQPTFDRAGIALGYATASEQTRAELDRFARSVGVDISQDPELSLLNIVCASYGRHIRQFSQCGLYRHSAHPNNLGVSARMGTIYFTDIDSCRLLEECSEIEKPIQVMRDAMSALYHLTIFLTEPRNIKSFTSERVCQANLYRTYLTSYYHEIPVKLIEEFAEILKERYLDMYQFVMQNYEAITAKREEAPASTSYQKTYDQNWRETWIRYEELYAWIVAITWFLHNESGMKKLYPFKTDSDKLFENLADLSSPQIVDKIQKRMAEAIDRVS